MRIVGLITARGGSKGLPRKNIAPVGGLPLIEWTIRAARASRIDRCIVSTDNEEIAAVCRAAGAEVPFMRPPELARDDSPHMDVLIHAIDWLDAEGSLPDYLVLLQPTSPLRTGADIDGAIDLAEQKDADSVISVCDAPVHPYWMRSLDDEGRMSDFAKWPTDGGYLQRQKLPPAYAMNGSVYVLKPTVLRERGTYFTDRTFGYVMPKERSLDIDTALDLKIANLFLSELNN